MSIEKKFICDHRECLGDEVTDTRAIRIARMNPWQAYFTFHLCSSCFWKFTHYVKFELLTENAQEDL